MPKYNSYKNYSTSSKVSVPSSVSQHLPYKHENSKSVPSSFSSNTNSFFQTVKEGFALGIGSSVGQLMTYSVLGGPKVNVEHTYVNDRNNILPCNNTKNCSELLLEYEKCKGDYNCNFDKLNELKNDYEKCKNK